MSPAEEKEYKRLLEKRESREGLSCEEYKHYLQLVDKAIREGFPQICNTWMEGFNR